MSTKPTDELLDHEYDGIREFDNPIPAWWTWMWIGSMVFSFFYFMHFTVLGTGQSVEESYKEEMVAFNAMKAEMKAKALANLSDEVIAGYMKDAEAMKRGSEKFAQVCAACHGQKAEGLVGPNLTDPYWLHTDGTLMSIRQVIAVGVLEKGMPAWEAMMTPEELVELTAFIGTLRNTNVPGKEPQGDKVGG